MAHAFRHPAGAILLALALIVAAPSHAAATFAQLKNIAGDVEVSPRNSGSWIAATPSTGLGNNDAVRTGASGAALLVHGRSELFLKPNTVTIIGYSSVQIRQGSLWFRMQKSEIGFKFVTDVAAATIRGTMGLIAATNEMTTVSLIKGRVEVTGEVDDRMLEPRTEAIIRRGRKIQVAPIPGSRMISLLADFHRTERDATGTGGRGGSSFDRDLRGQVGPRDSRGFPIPGLDPRTGGSLGYSSAGASLPSPTIGIAGSAPRLGVQSFLPGGSTAGIGGAVGTIGGAVGGAIGTIGGGVGGAIGTIGGAVGGVVPGPIGGAIGGATGGAGALIGGATGGAGALIGGATGGAGSLIGGATGGTGGLIP